MTAGSFAAVDLGRVGGRVMAGRVERRGRRPARGASVPERAGRPPPTARTGTSSASTRACGDGLELAARHPTWLSAGIDAWGVDYGLLDETGGLLGHPVHYRDARTERDRGPRCPAGDLYAVTGIQLLPFNTIYQLAATPLLRHARTMLLMPDLLAYWLTGEVGAEVTNASTTALYDVRARPGPSG